MARILIINDLTSEYNRALLRGVVRYSKEHGPWSFFRMPLHFLEMYGEEGVIDWARRWKADAAIIAQSEGLNIENMSRLGIPMVFHNLNKEVSHVCNLTGDYYRSGAAGAHYFLGKGYKNFAFYGSLQINWSKERFMGYNDQLMAAGFEVDVYTGDISPKNDRWVYNYEHLSNWLNTLPKPMALFASADYFGLHITESCRILGLNVPAEVAVLGVDDDKLFCEISDPPLSSIRLDVENGGYQTAHLLHRMIKGEIREPSDVVITHTGICERRSTDQYATDDKELLSVISYIHKNYSKTISVSDLTRFTTWSRRVLEMRFKRQFGNSVYQYVLNLRMNKLANELIQTEAPIFELAERCGFADPKNISRIFKKKRGLTPAEYRARYGIREE